MKEGDTFITLKEAAQISGYAPDYIGQLIRKGKISGKQIYHSVAWVTTEEAVRSYVASNQERGRDAAKAGLKNRALFGSVKNFFKNLFFTEEGFFRLVRGVLWVVAAFVMAALLGLAYVASVSLDRKLQERAIERAKHQEQNVRQDLQLPSAR